MTVATEQQPLPFVRDDPDGLWVYAWHGEWLLVTYAATPAVRALALSLARREGLLTWVRLEPLRRDDD